MQLKRKHTHSDTHRHAHDVDFEIEFQSRAHDVLARFSCSLQRFPHIYPICICTVARTLQLTKFPFAFRCGSVSGMKSPIPMWKMIKVIFLVCSIHWRIECEAHIIKWIELNRIMVHWNRLSLLIYTHQMNVYLLSVFNRTLICLLFDSHTGTNTNIEECEPLISAVYSVNSIQPSCSNNFGIFWVPTVSFKFWQVHSRLNEIPSPKR